SKEANYSAGLKTTVDAEHAKEDTTSDQPFVLLPLWPSNSLFSSKSLVDKEVIDAGKKTIQEPASENDQVFLDELVRLQNQKKEACDAADAADVIRRTFEHKCYNQGGAPISSSTKTFSVVHTPINTADDETSELVEINNDHNYRIFTHSSYDGENWDFQDDMVKGAVADNNNIDTSNVVSSIPITTVHSFHPKTQIIGDPSSAVKQEARNKKDKRRVMVRNKARLVAQGHMQEEGIDYDEVFALVARIEAISIFLAFASFMGFIVYQMDVKSAIDKTLFIKKDKKDIMLVQVYVDDIIFGSTKKSWCDEFEALMKSRFQMSSMGELTFFLGLQVKQKEDGIFLSQDKYVAEILKKFDFENVKTASTPIETQKPLVKDEEAADVDVHLYRSMIGSLMYLTTSRPDIMFAVCACSRFQVTPKTSHLNAVKRIFRYLKGRPKLGLWYPKESSFDLVAYSDSDYAGANLDRKSTTGAKYVTAAHCCGQVLWIQNQMLDYGFNFMNTQIFIDNESTISIVKNPVYHSNTNHIEIRHHFIRDSYEKKLIQVLKIHTDDNVADLLTKAFDGPRFNFLVVKHGFEVGWKLYLPLSVKDAKGITNLPDAKIYEGLATMGGFEGIRCVSFGLPALCLAQAQGEGSAIPAGSQPTSTVSIPSISQTPIPPLIEPSISSPSMITNRQEPKIPQSQGPTLTPVTYETTTNSVEVDAEGAATTTASLEHAEDSVQLKELMELVPKLVLRIDSLEKELTMTTQIFRNKVLTLKNRVKTLEVALQKKSKKVVLSESEGEEAENSSKQGRKSQDNRSEDFITPSNSGEAQEQDISPTLLDEANTLTQVASGGVSTYKRRRRFVDTGMDYFSAAKERTKSEEVNTGADIATKNLKKTCKNRTNTGHGKRKSSQKRGEAINPQSTLVN
ncbi:putative ribonuclease H-like domain-containing protein, partial [Tanacetum coccineum]